MCVCNHSQLVCTSLSAIATVSRQLQLKVLCNNWKYVQLIEFDARCDSLPRHLWEASSGNNGTGQTVWRPRSSGVPVSQPAGPGPLSWCHHGCCTIQVAPQYVWKKQHTTRSQSSHWLYLNFTVKNEETKYKVTFYSNNINLQRIKLSLF